MIQLRPYQRDLVAATLLAHQSGRQRVMATAPTGTGKTVSFVALHNEWPTEGQTLVLAHREELLAQAAASFQRADPSCWVETEQANRKASPMANVVVASVQTVGRPDCKRLGWLKPRLVICDECHHAPAASYRNAFERFGCFTEGGPFLLGVTATPKRLDRQALHTIFEEQVFSYTIKDAIADGYLCDIVGYRVATQTSLAQVRTTAGDYNQADLEKVVDVSERTGEAIRHWRQVAADRPTIVFCAGVAHAEHVAEAFQAEGVTAAVVTGKMDRESRRDTIARYKAGEIQVLTNVDVLTEGFDHPATSCIIMLRPTQSWSLYVQAVGRGTRLAPGKRNLIVLDVVDLCAKHSLATVPAILDLPPGMDLQGHSLKETADKLQELGAKASCLEEYQPKLFSDLQTVLESVDLLAGVEPPAEVREHCRLTWLRMHDGSYLLDCGGRGQKRTARLIQDLLGLWTVTLTQDGKTVQQFTSKDVLEAERALRSADRFVERVWPESGMIAGQGARWRQQPPTPKQVHLLTKFGVPAELIQTLDKGQASGLITQHMQKSGGRRAA